MLPTRLCRSESESPVLNSIVSRLRYKLSLITCSGAFPAMRIRHAFLRYSKNPSMCVELDTLYRGFTLRRLLTVFVELMRIAVGTHIAMRPPHKAVRAAFPHTASTLDI